MTEIPNANSFARPRKKGVLLKLTGKGWLYSGSWKKRYCVLDGTKFYFFENEKSKGSEKCSGVISLDYYDICDEYDTKDKKAPYAFIIGTSVRGFFDNRHQFSTSSKSDMQDWIRSVHDVITEARNSRSRNGRTRIIPGNSDHYMETESDDLIIDLNIEPEQLTAITKDRVRGPQGRRAPQRKSMMPTGSPIDELVQKQRSFSLSSPTEQNGENNESENSANGDSKRISLSMDAVDKNSDLEDDVINPRSSSNYEIFSNKSEEESKKSDTNGIILPKKPLFGKLGGQHAALTKELELKLKSGMAPGGRKMPTREDSENHEDNHTVREIKDLHKKVNQQDAIISNVRNNLEVLEKKVHDMCTNQPSDTSDKTESTIAQVLDVLRETADTLNEVQETHAQCEKVLEELKETKREHEELLKECQNYLVIIKEQLLAPPVDKENE